MNINKSGKFYHIKKLETETTKQLIERSWFVVNSLHLETNKLETKEELKEMEKNSRIWFNIKVLGCKYPSDLEKKIRDIEAKIFV